MLQEAKSGGDDGNEAFDADVFAADWCWCWLLVGALRGRWGRSEPERRKCDSERW
jgi:hypothetical protein